MHAPWFIRGVTAVGTLHVILSLAIVVFSFFAPLSLYIYYRHPACGIDSHHGSWYVALITSAYSMAATSVTRQELQLITHDSTRRRRNRRRQCRCRIHRRQISHQQRHQRHPRATRQPTRPREDGYETTYIHHTLGHRLTEIAQGKGPSLWYQFEAQVRRLPPHDEAIWSRTGSYTWAETYAQACRYGQFMLQNGVQSGELMAMYMMNRPEFLFVHLGSWAIGSAPAWINYNLAGDALVHCLKVAGAKVLLVDEDMECRQRIEDVRSRLEGELGITIKILDSGLKGEISRMEPIRPGDEMRTVAKGKFPLFLFYTR
jgi:hypothetical protein